MCEIKIIIDDLTENAQLFIDGKLYQKYNLCNKADVRLLSDRLQLYFDPVMINEEEE